MIRHARECSMSRQWSVMRARQRHVGCPSPLHASGAAAVLLQQATSKQPANKQAAGKQHAVSIYVCIWTEYRSNNTHAPRSCRQERHSGVRTRRAPARGLPRGTQKRGAACSNATEESERAERTVTEESERAERTVTEECDAREATSRGVNQRVA